MKKEPSSLWMVLLLVTCFLSLLLFPAVINRYNEHLFARMLEESKYIVEEEIPICLETERLVINASCTFDSSIHDISGKASCVWRDYCETTIYVDDELDDRSDREQYSFLSNVEDNIEQYIEGIIKKHYPEYIGYDKTVGKLHGVYGKRISSHELSQKIIVKTSRNVYEYNGVRNYYRRNGEPVDLPTVSQGPIYITKMPYVGMLESFINLTSLGRPTTEEKCKDFDILKASHRWKKYKWYEDDIQDLEHLKCIVRIDYYDYKNKIEVPGYVSDVSLYD